MIKDKFKVNIELIKVSLRGEGRGGGSGKNDWVVHIAFLALILADGGGWQALK